MGANNGRYEMRKVWVDDAGTLNFGEWAGYPSKADAIAATKSEKVSAQAVEIGQTIYYDESGSIYELRRRY